MGSEGRGGAEHSAERRETTAHLGSAREPERAAASSSSLFPSRPPSSSVLAWPVSRLYLCSSGSSAPLFLSAAPSNLSDPDKRGGLPPHLRQPARRGPRPGFPPVLPARCAVARCRPAGPPPGCPRAQRAPPGPSAPTSAGAASPAQSPPPRWALPPRLGRCCPPTPNPNPSRMAWGHCLPALRQLSVKIIIKCKTNTPIRSFLDTRVGDTAAQVFLFPGWK